MDPLVKAIKLLTIAVWCLSGLVALQIAIYLPSILRFVMNVAQPRHSEPVTTTFSSSQPPVKPHADATRFHDLPPEDMVAQASAILLVSYQRDGERFKAVVAEILKKDPKAELYYSVGDEIRHLSYYPRNDETRGEGQVVFMVGNPAEVRSSFSFDAGRIGGLGEMPLDVLRKMVKGSKG